MKILNCTPHDVNRYLPTDVDDPKTRKPQLKSADIKPTETFPKSDTVATADICTIGSGYDYEYIYKNVTDLPEGYDIYIVSMPYALACKALGRDTSRLRTLHKGVSAYGDDTYRTIGTLGLVKV